MQGAAIPLQPEERITRITTEQIPTLQSVQNLSAEASGCFPKKL